MHSVECYKLTQLTADQMIWFGAVLKYLDEGEDIIHIV
jgi:hypothetical protein